MERLKLSPHTVMTADQIEECGADVAEMLLSEAAPETAVVAGNDHAALSLIHALLRAGVDVPDHFSVTGFDDSHLLQLSYINLTAVHQDCVTMGRLAVEAAVERMTGTRTHPVKKAVTPTLVVRGSTAPPRDTDYLPIGW
jgi:DNA-binding LacI/PurR family transcriptional regulator